MKNICPNKIIYLQSIYLMDQEAVKICLKDLNKTEVETLSYEGELIIHAACSVKNLPILETIIKHNSEVIFSK